MSTLGKWWGRTAQAVRTNVSWIPSGYMIAGAPAYNSADGFFYVVLGPVTGGFGISSTMYVRRLYSSSNVVTFTTYAAGSENEKQKPFFYGGFLWILKSKSDKTLWLSKINITEGTETEVVKVYDNSASDAAAITASNAFDGDHTVYVIAAFEINATTYSYNVSKYDLQADSLSSLRTASAGLLGSLRTHGIGVDATTIHFMWQSADGTENTGTMALDGTGFASVGSLSLSLIGFRGNTLNGNKQIYVQGAQVYTFTDTPLAVWILRDGTDAQLKFAGFFSDGTNVFYEEWDGTSGSAVQKTKSSSLGAVANFICRGIFPFRSDLGLESAIGFNIGSNAYWYEAPSKMKEVV